MEEKCPLVIGPMAIVTSSSSARQLIVCTLSQCTTKSRCKRPECSCLSRLRIYRRRRAQRTERGGPVAFEYGKRDLSRTEQPRCAEEMMPRWPSSWFRTPPSAPVEGANSGRALLDDSEVWRRSVLRRATAHVRCIRNWSGCREGGTVLWMVWDEEAQVLAGPAPATDVGVRHSRKRQRVHPQAAIPRYASMLPG